MLEALAILLVILCGFLVLGIGVASIIVLVSIAMKFADKIHNGKWHRS